MRPFLPLFRNAHWQTIAAHYWPRRLDERRFPVEPCLYETEPGVTVLVETQRPAGAARGEILMVHGLESSSRASYLRSMAQAALEAGYAAHRFNMRAFYNAGLTTDLVAVLRQCRAPAHLVGYSLGGNVSLKLAGELGEAARPLIASVCAASTPIDLAACARKMCEPQNAIYHRRFVRRLIARTRRRGASVPELDRVRTIIEFDDLITGPAFGFRDAAHYYESQSASRFLAGIRVPTLLIQARDDPLIPFSTFDHPAIRDNPHIRLLETGHGGHVGFLSRRRPRFWLDQTVLEWAGQHDSPGRA